MTVDEPRVGQARAGPLQRLAKAVLLCAGLAIVAVTVWQLPVMDGPRTLWALARMPIPTASIVPVQGVAAGAIAPTFGASRSGNRRHHGIDIFAKRGTPVRSATRGVVLSVRDSGIGGKQVWVIGPASERHYYAHLDAWAPGLERGDVLEAGQLLGQVGDTGNARGTPPHLHYSVYGDGGALDPLPRLRAGTSNPASSPVSTDPPTR
ncbi:M23 family metallopeptidase [Lysobacter koreensis]|uniref:M23 family metallopeptidase n=1 Tax=Lysobacter koreensis TaxID=266122 RepID=A0ABW2YME2_9GAMM